MTSTRKFKQLLTPVSRLAFAFTFLLPVPLALESAQAEGPILQPTVSSQIFTPSVGGSVSEGSLSKWMNNNPTPDVYPGKAKGGGGPKPAQEYTRRLIGSNESIYVKIIWNDKETTVEFDGVIYKDGTVELVDTKAVLSSPSFYHGVSQDIYKQLLFLIQAARQQIAEKTAKKFFENRPVRLKWIISDPDVARETKDLFEDFNKYPQKYLYIINNKIKALTTDITKLQGDLNTLKDSEQKKIIDTKIKIDIRFIENLKFLSRLIVLEKKKINIDIVLEELSPHEKELAKLANSDQESRSKRVPVPEWAKISAMGGSFSDEASDILFGPAKSTSSDEAANPAPGGIDFSTLELRYIAEDSSLLADRGLRYAFNATPASSNKNLNAGRTAAVQASDAFFVWLSLSPDKFWVNLNPNEPDRIIDPQFGKTDAGRILLQADLRMKKTVAQLSHPDTSSGKQFWKQLKRGSSGTCLSFRQWIVPAPATVRKEGDGIYIADAPLNVKLESQYFQSKGAPGFLSSCPIMDKSIEAHNELVFRKHILPRVEKAVNTAPEYADLRRVYRSRVAAEWYRLRSASKATAYRDMVNNGDVSSWPARQDWSPRQVFNQYVNSITKGEFHVVHSHKWREGNMIYTQKQFYVYGGVDFTKVFFKQLNSIDFQKTQGDLRQVVDNSMKSPVADQHGKIWLGGSTTTGRAIWKTIWFYLALGLLALPFLIRWKRLYRKRFL